MWGPSRYKGPSMSYLPACVHINLSRKLHLFVKNQNRTIRSSVFQYLARFAPAQKNCSDIRAKQNLPETMQRHRHCWDKYMLLRSSLLPPSPVAGVVLMVGALFFAMIVVDKIMEWMGEQWNRWSYRGLRTDEIYSRQCSHCPVVSYESKGFTRRQWRMCILVVQYCKLSTICMSTTDLQYWTTI